MERTGRFSLGKTEFSQGTLSPGRSELIERVDRRENRKLRRIWWKLRRQKSKTPRPTHDGLTMEHASVQRDEAMEQDDAYESCKTTENNSGAEKRGVQLSRRKRTVLSKGELVQPSTLRKYGRWREALLMHCKRKDGVNGQYVHIGQAFPTMKSYHAAVESFLLHVHTSKDDDGCTSRELFGQAVYALHYFGKKLCIGKNWDER